MTIDKVRVLRYFLTKMTDDSRMSPAHISLFVALWNRWCEQEGSGWLVIFSREIRPLCKISSSSTFHKIIRQLHEYGYLVYYPSMDHYRGSRVGFDGVPQETWGRRSIT